MEEPFSQWRFIHKNKYKPMPTCFIQSQIDMSEECNLDTLYPDTLHLAFDYYLKWEGSATFAS